MSLVGNAKEYEGVPIDDYVWNTNKKACSLNTTDYIFNDIRAYMDTLDESKRDVFVKRLLELLNKTT